jgi:SNF2 family DNA or RNA helicase
LQSITLVWTLLRQGFDGSPLAKRVLIVTPTSLVSNWESELNKWLDGRVNVMAIGESTRAEVISGISSFLSPRNPFQVDFIILRVFCLDFSVSVASYVSLLGILVCLTSSCICRFYLCLVFPYNELINETTGLRRICSICEA